MDVGWQEVDRINADRIDGDISPTKVNGAFWG